MRTDGMGKITVNLSDVLDSKNLEKLRIVSERHGGENIHDFIVKEILGVCSADALNSKNPIKTVSEIKKDIGHE